MADGDIYSLWSNNRLHSVRTDDRFDAFPNFWLDTFFKERHYSEETDGSIKFAKLPEADRFMAPFVEPTHLGVPVLNLKGETAESFKPGYIKLLDAVRPEDASNPQPFEIRMQRKMTAPERFDLRVMEIMKQHVRKIRMREAWMAARTMIDGKQTISYHKDQGAPHSEVTIDFGRDASLTIVKSADYWSTAATKILDDVEDWGNLMSGLPRGGAPTTLVLGRNVLKPFRNNTQVREELASPSVRRGTAVDIPTGILFQPTVQDPIRYVGTLGNGIEVWCYSDKVQDANGDYVDLFDPDSVALIAPGNEGVRCYGLIQDVAAFRQGVALSSDIFQKMYENENPSALYLLSQCAPLMVPLYPNRFATAKVLA